MARTRTHAAELARLLNAAPLPVYALDDRLVIVFCNEACLAWVGLPAEELLGRRCAYHSGPAASPADAAADGLCPPPEAVSGGHTVALVAAVDATGRVRRRRARFLSLGSDAAAPGGVVAVVDGADLPEGDLAPGPDAPSPESAWLHEQVRSFRVQAAARVRADRLIGEGLVMRRVRAQIEAAAACRASVLLVGPKGSGRQHAAQAVHYAADPALRGPIVPLACSVLAGELVQSTVAALAARHRVAPGGPRATLLLNDVDHLPGDSQGPLAAVLAARGFPLRVISTSSAPLMDLAGGGAMREDLAALLSTLVIALPPLAQRREDLPLLAQAFVEEINARGGKQLRGFSSEALDRLDAYPWPGNLDELAQVAAEAHQRAEGPEIAAADLPKRIRLAAEAEARPRRVEETIVLDEFLARVERELVRRALAHSKGNKAKAARLLGVTRPRLYRRMVQLGLA